MRESRKYGSTGLRWKAALKSEWHERDVRKPLASVRRRERGRGGDGEMKERGVSKFLDLVGLDGVCEKS